MTMIIRLVHEHAEDHPAPVVHVGRDLTGVVVLDECALHPWGSRFLGSP